MKKYTDADVQRLVSSVSKIKSVRPADGTYQLWIDAEELFKILAPFRSDPDEQILSAMSEAYAVAVGLADIDFVNPGMKAVLAMLREEGLYAPTTEETETPGAKASQ